MINTDRIVPVQATDLITLYSVILKQDSNNSTLDKLTAAGLGEFQITSGSKPLLANEPVVTIDIDATTSSVSACTVYFVPAYDYAGFTIDGTAVETAGADVVADGNTLYKATLSSGTIAVSKVGL